MTGQEIRLKDVEDSGREMIRTYDLVIHLQYSYLDPAWLTIVTPDVPVINPNAYTAILVMNEMMKIW